jgi:hypothetical protein
MREPMETGGRGSSCIASGGKKMKHVGYKILQVENVNIVTEKIMYLIKNFML